MAAREHVIITGTGRCGTTFLVELLTNLGLQTGFNKDELGSKKLKLARAGLEHDIRLEDCPYIVKSPFFCDHAEDVVRRDDIVIEHIFVPMRDLNAAAESRRHVLKDNLQELPFSDRVMYALKPCKFPGGLWNTKSGRPGRQEEMLLRKVYKLLLAVSGIASPITFMRYPRIVQDCRYLYGKLQPIMTDIKYESFSAAFSGTVRPELVHRFNQDDC